MPEARDTRIIELAAKTIEQAFIGVMSTVDSAGTPQSRFMAAVADGGGLQRLFCLTATETRKVHEIRNNPNVCWLFADHDYKHIVRLHGQASFISTSDLAMSVWNRLIDHVDAYATEDLRDQSHYAFHTIVTQLQTLELLSPEMGMVVPRVVPLD